MSQESLNSNNPWENEELTEAELDALAGGELLIQPNPYLMKDFLGNETVFRPTSSAHANFPGAQNSNNPFLANSFNGSLAFP